MKKGTHLIIGISAIVLLTVVGTLVTNGNSIKSSEPQNLTSPNKDVLDLLKSIPEQGDEQLPQTLKKLATENTETNLRTPEFLSNDQVKSILNQAQVKTGSIPTHKVEVAQPCSDWLTALRDVTDVYSSGLLASPDELNYLASGLSVLRQVCTETDYNEYYLQEFAGWLHASVKAEDEVTEHVSWGPGTDYYKQYKKNTQLMPKLVP